MVCFSRGNFADSLKSHLKLLSPYWLPYRKYGPEIGLNASKISPKPTRLLWHIVDASWNDIYSKTELLLVVNITIITLHIDAHILM